MRFALLALILAGCGPATAVLSDPRGEGDTDTDTDADSDTDVDTDSDTDLVPDLSIWEGSRAFTFEDIFGEPCEDEVEEYGDNVTLAEDWGEAVAACDRCDHVFLVEVSPDRICDGDGPGSGLEVATPVLRGLELVGDGGAVTLYRIGQSWDGWSAEAFAEGELNGIELTYSYEGSVFNASYSVEGYVEF